MFVHDYLLVVAAVPYCVTSWQRDSPHQFEQSTSLLQHVLHGVHAASQTLQMLLLHHLWRSEMKTWFNLHISVIVREPQTETNN